MEPNLSTATAVPERPPRNQSPWAVAAKWALTIALSAAFVLMLYQLIEHADATIVVDLDHELQPLLPTLMAKDATRTVLILSTHPDHERANADLPLGCGDGWCSAFMRKWRSGQRVELRLGYPNEGQPRQAPPPPLDAGLCQAIGQRLFIDTSFHLRHPRATRVNGHGACLFTLP